MCRSRRTPQADRYGPASESGSICAEAMAKDQRNRYATASEFRTICAAFANGGVPIAAAFNPLTVQANMKARKQAEMDAATVPHGAGDGCADAGVQSGHRPSSRPCQIRMASQSRRPVRNKRARPLSEGVKMNHHIASVVQPSIVVLLAVTSVFYARSARKCR